MVRGRPAPVALRPAPLTHDAAPSVAGGGDGPTDKLAAWQRHQCLGQLNEDDQTRQLDLFQPECEQMASALLALRDQLRRLLALQEHLSLKQENDTGSASDAVVPTGLLTHCQLLLRRLVQQCVPPARTMPATRDHGADTRLAE